MPFHEAHQPHFIVDDKLSAPRGAEPEDTGTWEGNPETVLAHDPSKSLMEQILGVQHPDVKTPKFEDGSGVTLTTPDNSVIIRLK